VLNKTIEAALNDQIQVELHSAYIYLAMSAHFETQAMPGCAAWMRFQAQEEVGHAMRLFSFVNDRGGRVILKAIDQPEAEYGSPKAVFEAALKHEQYVTGTIHNLYALAVKENDFAAQSHLQWFIDEQVEEEKTAGDIVDLFAKAGDHEAAILMIDQQLGQRPAPAPAPAE
jgi:ferritin